MTELDVTLRGFEIQPGILSQEFRRAPDIIIVKGSRTKSSSGSVYSKNALVFTFYYNDSDKIEDIIYPSVEIMGGWKRLIKISEEFNIEFIEFDVLARTEGHPGLRSQFLSSDCLKRLAEVGASIGITIDCDVGK